MNKKFKTDIFKSIELIIQLLRNWWKKIQMIYSYK